MANNSFGICKYLIVLLFIFLSAPHLSLSSLEEEEEDIHDLLPKYLLPRGVIPKNVESYTLSPSSGDFFIKLTGPYELEIGNKHSKVWYQKEIRGNIRKRVMSELSGIEVAVRYGRCPVTRIIMMPQYRQVLFDWRCCKSDLEAFSAADFEKVRLSSNRTSKTTAFMSKSVV
ncbi:hypothetical protein Tsubulata_012415 [Turnera subulata]|uniref:Uncharacterized protein n=1 Tax=Turnera subulata TaxID=218843 RepID=A0A9Q0GIB1_9ROSI|nr:hypothetical protein Tsubulata_012415 [Turnera subulata]